MSYIFSFLTALLLTCNVFGGFWSKSSPSNDFDTTEYYISLQIPTNPSTGHLVTGNIATLTLQAITNLEHQLTLLGMSLHNVVKTTVYLTDINTITPMTAAYKTRFNGLNHPAQTVIQVGALPDAATVGIDCIARK